MLALMLALTTLPALAQEQVTLRDAFANAPDNLFPLLTRNNRLDCMDFAEGKVDMEVKNRADGTTRIDSITQDYLRVLMSPKSRMELRLLPATEQKGQRLCVIHTCMGPAQDSQVTLYDNQWNRLGQVLRPRPEAFTDGQLSHETMGLLADLALMWAAFTPDGDGLVWTLDTTELNTKQRREAEGHLHTITTPITTRPYSK